MVKKIEGIARQAFHLGIFSLSPSELIQYYIFRTSRFLKNNCIISQLEHNYLMCETGLGKIRFDPELNDILTKKIYKIIDKKMELLILNNYIFFCKQNLKEDIRNSIINEKLKLMELIQSDYNNAQLKSDISNILIKTLKPKAQIGKVELLSDSIQIEFTLEDIKFIIKYLIGNKWIYPYSQEIWSLYHECKMRNLFPVVIASGILGSCYSLFKSIGILGFKALDIYVYKKTLTECNNFIISYGTALEEGTSSSLHFKTSIDHPYDFTIHSMAVIEDGLQNGDNSLKEFTDSVLTKLISNKNYLKFITTRNKLQKELTEDDYNIIDIDTFPKILNILPKNKLIAFTRNWYRIRKKLLDDIDAL